MNNLKDATPLPNQPQYNTYVGARYVPLYDGDWDATKKYEPLTVVQFQGRSYTSKTFVAAGIPVTDANFWALSGEYNGQVGMLQEQVNRLETTVTTLNTEVDEVANNVTNLSTKVEQTTTAERLITNSHLLAGKKVYLIGDSITADSIWSETLKEWLENTGGTLTNASISGMSTVGLWNEVISKMTSFPYDVFILQSGINDLHTGTILGSPEGTTQNSLYWGLTQILRKIQTLNTNAVCVVIGAGNLAAEQTQYKWKLARLYGWAMEGCTKKFGGIYIDLGSMPGQTHLNSGGSKDHLHPSDYFADNVMGQMIIDAINSGGIPCSDLEIEMDINYIPGLLTAADGITISVGTIRITKNRWNIFCYFTGTIPDDKIVARIGDGWIPNSTEYAIGATYAGQCIIDMGQKIIKVLSSDGLFNVSVTPYWSGISN